MSSFANSAEPPFAAAGGLEVAARADEDPYRTLDDLMSVIEALCPVWPQRAAFADDATMLM